MHTFTFQDIKFHYNSDGFGVVIIAKPKELNFYVPAEALLRFVSHLLRTRKIEELEEMTDSDILGMDIPIFRST